MHENFQMKLSKVTSWIYTVNLVKTVIELLT